MTTEERARADERNEVGRFISMYLGMGGDSEYKKGRRDAMQEVANFLKSRTVICNHSGYAETDAAGVLRCHDCGEQMFYSEKLKPLEHIEIGESVSETINAIVDVVNELHSRFRYHHVK